MKRLFFGLLLTLGCAAETTLSPILSGDSPRTVEGVHRSPPDGPTTGLYSMKPTDDGQPGLLAGHILHGTFDQPVAVDLLPPAPIDEPLARLRRRVDIDQLDALIRAATGGIGWEVAGKNQFTELSLTLGKPDYLDQTNEDLEPTALFQKFLGDAARAACRDVRAKDVTLPAESRVLMIAASPTDTMATAAEAIDLNLRALLLRYHGRQVDAEVAELEHWRWLYETAELKLADPSLAWQAVCVGLMTHPDFYTY